MKGEEPELNTTIQIGISKFYPVIWLYRNLKHVYMDRIGPLFESALKEYTSLRIFTGPRIVLLN